MDKALKTELDIMSRIYKDNINTASTFNKLLNELPAFLFNKFCRPQVSSEVDTICLKFFNDNETKELNLIIYLDFVDQKPFLGCYCWVEEETVFELGVEEETIFELEVLNKYNFYKLINFVKRYLI